MTGTSIDRINGDYCMSGADQWYDPVVPPVTETQRSVQKELSLGLRVIAMIVAEQLMGRVTGQQAHQRSSPIDDRE